MDYTAVFSWFLHVRLSPLISVIPCIAGNPNLTVQCKLFASSQAASKAQVSYLKKKTNITLLQLPHLS